MCTDVDDEIDLLDESDVLSVVEGFYLPLRGEESGFDGKVRVSKRYLVIFVVEPDGAGSGDLPLEAGAKIPENVRRGPV